MLSTQYPTANDLLDQATNARKAGDEIGSCDALRAFLRCDHALLWLSKQTPEPLEALAAAELAFRIEPMDEVAQRAIGVARERVDAMAPEMRARAELAAAAVLTTGMTLREARTVIWPFRGINEPIGDALDAGKITLRDLGWALEKSYGSVRTAARTILFTRVADLEPATLPRPLRVISGSRYAEYQERRSFGFSLIAACAVLVLCAALVITGISSWWFGKGSMSWIALVILAPLLWYLERQMNRREETATFYRLGRWGEERIVESLRALLDDQWTLFRNLIWPDKGGGDIDMILVGPGGIWAFEVKTYSGTIRNIEDKWERKYKRGWQVLFSHPGKQARGSAVRLKTFLAEQNIEIDYVKPVVIWASSRVDTFEVEGTLTVERPRTLVWKTDELPDYIERILQEKSVLSQDTVNKIVNVLDATAAEARRYELQKHQNSRRPSSQSRAS